MHVYHSADISLRLKAAHGKLYHGIDTVMTIAGLQHTLEPFGTFNRYLPLVEKDLCFCLFVSFLVWFYYYHYYYYYRTEIRSPYNSKNIPERKCMLSHRTKRWILKQLDSKKTIVIFHMLGIARYVFSWEFQVLERFFNSLD